MMSAHVIKKLFRTALYTSPVISALIITPVFIFNGSRLNEYPLAFLMICVLVFFVWMINILIIYQVSKNKKNKVFSLRKYLLSYLVCVVVILIVIDVGYNLYAQPGDDAQKRIFHFHLIILLAINTSILILEDLVLIKERNIAIELENSLLKMKNMEAVNQQLKQQIHPHFLFNSLSTLKALIKSSPAGAEEYLVRLSEFLRFSMSEVNSNTVKVADELKLCTGYLEMQKIRFGEALRFSISIPGDIMDRCYVPAFAVQMLVENAIKHNNFTAEQPLLISIEYADETITVSNNLQKKPGEENSGGLGLANLRERYKILAGKDIVVDLSKDEFSVSIKVLHYESSDNRG